MRYEVPIIYRGQCTFIVDADSPDEAKERAEAKFKGGDQPDEMGNEWEEVDRVCDARLVEENEKEAEDND